MAMTIIIIEGSIDTNIPVLGIVFVMVSMFWSAPFSCIISINVDIEGITTFDMVPSSNVTVAVP